MTNERGNRIGNYDAWSNLEARYALEARGAAVPKSFANTVIPIASADDAIAVHELEVDSLPLNGTIGVYTPYFTVPDGEEWLVWMIHREATVGVTGIHAIVNQRNGVGANVALSLLDNLEIFPQYERLRVVGGGTIGLLNTGNAGDTGIFLEVYYRRLPIAF